MISVGAEGMVYSSLPTINPTLFMACIGRERDGFPDTYVAPRYPGMDVSLGAFVGRWRAFAGRFQRRLSLLEGLLSCGGICAIDFGNLTFVASFRQQNLGNQFCLGSTQSDCAAFLVSTQLYASIARAHASG